MRTILLASAALLVIAPATMAQSPGPASTAQTQTSQNSNANGTTAEPQHIRANLRSALEKAGYKEIRVAPTSFMVHAKDSEGNAVVMSISPDSFTEVSEVGTNSSTGSTTGASNNNAAGGTFVSVPQADELSSKVVGLDIYTNDNKDIGQIKDIALNQNGRSQAFIVSVGGFLGMGEHYVAVSPSAVKITYNDQDKKWHATMNAAADQLKSAPEFKYTGRWQGSRT